MTISARRRLLLGLAAVLLPSLASAQEPEDVRTLRASAQEASGGSSVPCAIPLGWRLTDIDPRFGLSADAADAALRAAFRIWESAAGSTLFEVAESGHPVSFVFDQRQETALRRRAERDAAEAQGRELEEARGALEALQAEARRRGAAYEAAAGEHSARTRHLNEEIARWNQRSAIPDSVRTRLEAERDDLAEVAAGLDVQRRAVQASNESVNDASRRLNQRIAEYNRRQERLAQASPGLTQAARYDEEVTTRDGRVEDVQRRIRVFRYDGADDLVFVLAHELGHALGLGHASVTGAIMSEVTNSGERGSAPALHPRDLEMLGALCPGLAGG